MRTYQLLLSIAAFACCLTASAYDLKLTNGRVLADIRLRVIEPTGIIVRVGESMEFVDYAHMAEEDKLTFGFVQSKYEAAAAKPAPTTQAAAPTSPTPAVTPAPKPPAPRTTQTTATPAPTSSGQCAATTKKGTRCSRRASAGSIYCYQHP